jgi:hypothetical protein
MPDAVAMAATLLVAGPAIGTACLAYPPFVRVWTVPREEHLALVDAHPVAWRIANAGFTVATVLTAAGLFVLAGSVNADEGPRAALLASAVAYAIAGSLWCAILAIRTRTTPAIAAMVAAASQTEPAETLLGSVIGGLYQAFLLITGFALIGIGSVLALSGGGASPAGWLATIIASLAVARHATSGDVIPAVIYIPMLLVGLALLLVGW